MLSELDKLSNLSVSLLFSSVLSGIFSNELGTLTEFTVMMNNNNELSSRIPSGLGKCRELTV